jgi:predicted Zn-dependent protease
VPHVEVVEALVETLSFRHIGVVTEEYAISKDGMKMFGVLDFDTGMPGCRFSIGIRNSHDRRMRLAAVVGVRVLVCENTAFSGDFTLWTMSP